MIIFDPSPRIRRARENDAPVIAQIHVLSWRAAYRDQIPGEALNCLSVGESEEEWRGRLRGAAGTEERVWIAEAGGSVAGFLDSRPSGDADVAPMTGELTCMYFLTEWWGKGIGRALLSHTLEDLKGRGFRVVTGWILSANERARSFFEAAGFVTDGPERDEELGGAKIRHVRYRLDLD